MEDVYYSVARESPNDERFSPSIDTKQGGILFLFPLMAGTIQAESSPGT
jgi:hypothetical protein